jgi:hypothetical protein
MPGTRNIQELEKDQEPPSEETTDWKHKTLVSHAHYLLNVNNRPPIGKPADQGFVVVGTGYEALKEAHAVLSKKKPVRHAFPPNEDLTLVFFAYDCSKAVTIDQVIREKKQITVKYRFHSHDMRMHASHFVLIPIGKFANDLVPIRKIQVIFERLPDTGSTKQMSDERAMATICSSFTFGITEE